MHSNELGQWLILLASSVLVVTLLRRVKLPPIVGYLAVGMLLGPAALRVADTETTRVMAEFGVVFLVFTLGLEFSFPRMVAMRWQVFGLGGAQVIVTTAVIAAFAHFGAHLSWLICILLGGALAMSSTAIVIKQLTEQLEVNRTHGRLAVGILLFQDLVFVPLLAVESVAQGSLSSLNTMAVINALVRAAFALLVVLAAGRLLLRPLFNEIGHARSTELFTLTVLLVALASAWATNAAGMSLALGAFLAGMLLAETEYRHQVEVVIRPFRDILLGLFFITIGTLLDFRLLYAHAGLVLLLLVLLQFVKALIVVLLSRLFARSWRAALQTGLVTAQGGEFGFALLTLMLNDKLAGDDLIQPLLAATVLSMVLSTLLIRHNSKLGEWYARRGKEMNELERELMSTREVAQRNHVILCGFGRVGQNLARALEKHALEYIALDMDPRRVQLARQAGDPVIYGDAAHHHILESVGLAHCNVVVITFANPDVAMRIVHAVREMHKNVPILVRTQDDTKLDQLQQAGATEVVPETLEASLMLMSHMLLLLEMPVSKVVKTVGDIRDNRYAMLRRIFRREDARPLDETHALREELHSVVLPPNAYAIGRSIKYLDLAAFNVGVNSIRRHGLLLRQPDPETVFIVGDIVVLYGTPEDIERGESKLLIG